jgi:chemotaxis protein MotB
MDKARPIVILKKKGGHGGHHGGAWKVAYADFVTAMMAFFLVLWLVSSAPKPVKEAIAGYFNDPSGSGSKAGTSMSGTGENLSVTRDDMPMLKEQLEQAMKKMPDFQNLHDHVEMTITSEGLRIELSESAVGTFFDSGSPKLNGDGKDMLILLAQQLGKLPNHLSIEGHTDSKPYAKGANYGNWELSSDRANAARRLMQANGVSADQVKQVRGFADQRLRKPADPLDPSNRRISVIVQYMPKGPEDEEAKSAEGEAKPEEKPNEKPGEKSVATPAEKSEAKSETKPDTKPDGAPAKPSAGAPEKK